MTDLLWSFWQLGDVPGEKYTEHLLPKYPTVGYLSGTHILLFNNKWYI